MITLGGQQPNNNQSILDRLQALQIQGGIVGAQEQLDAQNKLAEQKAMLASTAQRYIETPEAFNDMEAAYIKQAAPMAGINISQGVQADRGGHVGSKMLGAGVGALDALLFDLIPDKAYVNRYNKGWSSAGKWASTIASLAIPGIGMLKGASAAKALSAGTRLGSKEVLERVLANNSDDVVRIFGKEAVENGTLTLAELETGVNKAMAESKKGISAIAKKYSVTTPRKAVDGKVKIWVNGVQKEYSVTTKTGAAALKKGVPVYDPKKIQAGIEKKVAASEAMLQKKMFAKYDSWKSKIVNDLIEEKAFLSSITDKLGRPLRGYTKETVADFAARIAKNEERLTTLADLTAPAGQLRRTAKAASELISGNAIDDMDELARLAEASTPAFNIKKSLNAISKSGNPTTTGISGIKRNVKSYILASDETERSLLKTAIDAQVKEIPISQKATMLKEVKKQATAIAKKPIPAKYKTVASRAAYVDRKMDAVKAANELLESITSSTRLARNVSNVARWSVPGMARGGLNSLQAAMAPGVKFGDRFIHTLTAMPQLAMASAPAFHSMAPMSVEQAAGGSYGILNPLFAPGMQQANMSALPYGGMMPMMPGSGTQQDVQTMQGL